MSLVKAGKAIDERYVKAFSAITTFVADLWEIYATKTSSPLALYRRLTEHISFTNTEGILRATSGFEAFFKAHEKLLVEDKLDALPVGTVIGYHDGKVASIEIQKFIHKSDASTKTVIREHLLTIRAILDPSKDKLAELTAATSAMKMGDVAGFAQAAGNLNIPTDTVEGEFVNSIMTKTKDVMSNVNLENPMVAMMELMKSGIVSELVEGLQVGVGSGRMDMTKLFGTMQAAIGSIMPPPQSGAQQPTVEEVKDVTPPPKQ